MTEGAKKRKAFADWCRMGMRAWATHAKTWRVGERLRPCPGCKNCGYEPTVKLWMLRRGLWCYGSLGVRDISRICHGNGIVPARKARKVRG